MRSCITAIVALLCTSAAGADELVFEPSKDNTLYFSTAGVLSNGQGPGIFAGTNAVGAPRRALIAFDLGPILPASTIQSVTLTLFMSQSIAVAQDVRLHRVTNAWGEGASVAVGGGGGGGAGGPAAPGDATWLHRFSPTDLWTTPGGDFDASASASTSVGSQGSYSWSSPQMVADVQSWVTSGNSFGWILITNELSAPTAKRFESRESSIPSLRPMLHVVFTRSPTDVAPQLASRLVLAPASPNPFNPSTSLRFELPFAGRARLTVHDVRGRLLATLVDAPLDEGWQRAEWDGRAAGGQPLASGVYVTRLEHASGTRMQRVVLSK